MNRSSTLGPLFGFKTDVYSDANSQYPIEEINPLEQGFYFKRVEFEGIPIKSAECVENRALHIARERLTKLFANMGSYRSTILEHLRKNSVELHIVGRTQAMTDLPENRSLKGKPMDEFAGQTWDERARGSGGRLVSCGEENLLSLPGDRYAGTDICLHEFAHALRNFGLSKKVRTQFDQQYENSIAKKLWIGNYAGSNPDEFFAELTVRYFGKRKEGFRSYDPDSFALFDSLYRGRHNAADFQNDAK